MAEVDAGAIAPVVNTPVAAPEATPTPDTTADQVVTPESPEAKAERTFTQKELDDIVQKRLAKESKRAERLGEERARREAAERELERLRTANQPKPPQGEPNPENYTDPKEFVRDLIRWERQQETEQSKQVEREQLDREYTQRQVEYVAERFDLAEDKFPGLKDRLTDVPALTPRMLEFVIEDDHGFTVGDYLSEHHDEAKKIARLAPYKQLQELRTLAARLTAPPKTTTAPAPIVPNTTAAKVETGYRPDMTDKQFSEWRRRQKAQRG
jgi:hypothetical protein